MWKKLNTSYDVGTHSSQPLYGGLKFHGLSTPEDLINMWKELKHDEDNKDLNVIFDYVKPEQLKDGFNILNIKYDASSKEPKTGHYVLVSNLPNYKEFFDPIAENTINDIYKINELSKYFESLGDELNVSLEGKQQYNNSDCGYHCLTHALNLYNSDKYGDKSQPGGKLPTNPTKQDILMDILKLNRAIYYQLKTLTDNKVINLKMKALMSQWDKVPEKMKEQIKDKGKGVSDDYDVNKLKNIEYKQLKGLIED